MDSAHTHMTVYVLSLTHASLVAVPSLSRKAGNSPVMGSYTGMVRKEQCGEEDDWIDIRHRIASTLQKAIHIHTHTHHIHTHINKRTHMITWYARIVCCTV